MKLCDCQQPQGNKQCLKIRKKFLGSLGIFRESEIKNVLGVSLMTPTVTSNSTESLNYVYPVLKVSW